MWRKSVVHCSIGCGLTCRRWAKVMVNYHRASKVVDPYREAIRSGEVNLEELVAARQSSAIG